MFRLIKSKHVKCSGIAVKSQEDTMNALQVHTHTAALWHNGPQLPHGFLSRELIVI